MERQSSRSPRRPPGPSTTGPEERPSWETVYRAQAAWVHATLRRLGVAERWCPDALHDVFLVVQRRLPEYEPRDRLRGWLGAIAYHVAAKYRDREGRMESTDEGADLDGLHDPDDPEAAIASAEDVRFLHRVLDEIDPELRFVLLQHHRDGVPVAEIAEHMDVPAGTVKTRLARARKVFKAAWARLAARDRHDETKPHRAVVLPLFGPLSLLEADQRIPPLPPGVREKVWADLRRDDGGGGLTPGALPGGAPRSAATPAAARFRAARLVAAGGVFVAGVLVGALWDPFHRRSPSDTTAAPPELLAVPPRAVAPVALTPATAAPSAAPPASAAASGAASGRAAPDTEKTLMDKVSGALAGGELEKALEALQRHARDFPAGKRAEQCETLWIATLLRQGNAAEARERFAQFERAYPRSPRLSDLRAAVAPP